MSYNDAIVNIKFDHPDIQAIHDYHWKREGVLRDDLMVMYQMMLDIGIFETDKEYFAKRSGNGDDSTPSATSEEPTESAERTSPAQSEQPTQSAEQETFIWPEEQEELGEHLKSQQHSLLNIHLETVDPAIPPDAPYPLFGEPPGPDTTSMESTPQLHPRIDSRSSTIVGSPAPTGPTYIDSPDTPALVNRDDCGTMEDARSPTVSAGTSSSHTIQNDPPMSSVRSAPSVHSVPIALSTSTTKAPVIALPRQNLPAPAADPAQPTSIRTNPPSTQPPPFIPTIDITTVTRTELIRAHGIIEHYAHELIRTGRITRDRRANSDTLRRLLADVAFSGQLTHEMLRSVLIAGSVTGLRRLERRW
ncbi:hypothetical protein PMZ80_006765 [Knufia obscura]|uniref:Uncharacterized protein n=1 Tax=Knufia obscura TaxID=1635080 RepID=A0ABR0RLJ3_9EURO|nr:hypothetical protein PMZ80_006765 [Knufia obscura]